MNLPLFFVNNVRTVSNSDLQSALSDQHEIALLDVRKKSDFVAGHLWLAINVPAENIEQQIRRLVPRRTTRIVLCDADNDDAPDVATRLLNLGYDNVSCLAHGVSEWQKDGLPVIKGDYVISHSFGFSVEQQHDVPIMSAHDLTNRLQQKNKPLIIDTRDRRDYLQNSLPGSINVPIAEVASRVPALVSGDQIPIVVHCAGVTRAALGAQTLIDANIPNPVYSLRDGTRGWFVAGGELINGQHIDPVKPNDTANSLAISHIERLRRRHSLRYVTSDEINDWRIHNSDRTCYVIDVRTAEEYATGHYPDAIHVPGGELAGMTIDHIATYHARLCLLDNGDCARAEITAAWMLQLGWNDVVILKNWKVAGPLEQGTENDQSVQTLSRNGPVLTQSDALEDHRKNIALRYEIYQQFLQDKPWQFSIVSDDK